MQPIVKPTKTQHKAWQYLNDKKTEEILFGGAAGGGPREDMARV